MNDFVSGFILGIFVGGAIALVTVGLMMLRKGEDWEADK